jgi:hypothetical protein
MAAQELKIISNLIKNDALNISEPGCSKFRRI